ncbi:MAG: hypothetical protein K0Q79_345 [Flavipsychrobacter sp.]|jgi:hypothetical protein|nr:hypothetical protein [Flavipsychrobacter sp.]
MEYEYSITTIPLHKRGFRAEVKEVIATLKRHNIIHVNLMYGWSWGDWTPFESLVNDVLINIDKQRQKTGDRFPGNDVYIDISNLEVQIIFCHEHDIHLQFNRVDKFILEIISRWGTKKILNTAEKRE